MSDIIIISYCNGSLHNIRTYAIKITYKINKNSTMFFFINHIQKWNYIKLSGLEHELLNHSYAEFGMFPLYKYQTSVYHLTMLCFHFM